MEPTTQSADFLDDLEDLSSAEEFLEYFGIAFDAKVVQVNRLHILQRFHDYLTKHAQPGTPLSFAEHRHWLGTAYEDFVTSDAQTEKVFRVFHMHEPQTTFVPLADIFH
jgi:nitrogenase-stabilizing/protective protein